jgi:hypothetical protein
MLMCFVGFAHQLWILLIGTDFISLFCLGAFDSLRRIKHASIGFLFHLQTSKAWNWLQYPIVNSVSK